MHEVTYLQAVNEALSEEMDLDERVFIMGEDVAWNILGTTEGSPSDSARNGCATRRSVRRGSWVQRRVPRWLGCDRSLTC